MLNDKHRSVLNKDLEALQGLILVARNVLRKPEKRELEQTLRYFAVSLANSSVAVATLCGDGYGADALKVARGMFETHIIFRYLLLRPNELSDYLNFDAVARYKRLRLYKTKFPRMYSLFSAGQIKAAEHKYLAVKKNFMPPNGKLRGRWCRHDLAEMARMVGRAEMYDLFYRHASLVLHTDPMGLAMLIDGATREVQPGPSARHIGLPARIASMIFHDTLSEYSKLVGADHTEVLKRIDGLIGGEIAVEGSFLGSLSEAF